MVLELFDAGEALSPIVIVVISAVSGLASGVFGSLVSPWVHYSIESKRKQIEYKEGLIKDTRTLLDKVKTIAEIRASSLWGFIESNLSEMEREVVFPQAYVVELSRGPEDCLSLNDLRKRGISNMLSRLEREWKLI